MARYLGPDDLVSTFEELGFVVITGDDIERALTNNQSPDVEEDEEDWEPNDEDWDEDEDEDEDEDDYDDEDDW